MAKHGTKSYSNFLQKLSLGWLGLSRRKVEEKLSEQEVLQKGDLDRLKQEPGWEVVLQILERHLQRRAGVLLDGDDEAKALRDVWKILSEPPNEVKDE